MVRVWGLPQLAVFVQVGKDPSLLSYLQFMDFLVELRPDSLPIGKLGLQLLQLHLQLLLLVLHLLLGLTERPDLVAQVRISLLQRLLGFVQISLGLKASRTLSRAGGRASKGRAPLPLPPIWGYPLELLQLLGQLFHGLGVLLAHLLHLGLVDSRLLLQRSLQDCHLLLPLRSEPQHKGP